METWASMGSSLSVPRSAAIGRPCRRHRLCAGRWRAVEPVRCAADCGDAGAGVTIDWATIASFATAVGTLVLAVATFAAVRSLNRSARIAEAAFQVNLRPVLVTSRLEDPMQKIRWVDDHWARRRRESGQCRAGRGREHLSRHLAAQRGRRASR